MKLWIRIGDDGDYRPLDDLADAIDYLNSLSVGTVDRWIDAGPGVGFETPNFHGYDFVSCYWGDDKADLVRPLDAGERAVIECCLEEVFI